MIIHVVNSGEDINSIADQYNISATRLIQDNGLDNPYSLVPGQTIVIVYPEQIYNVQQGDSLAVIADKNQITLMQLLRNNSFLFDRNYIYPGENLVIKYKTERTIVTNAFVYPYVEYNTLLKTLPNLTYISIFNYSTIEAGDITAYAEDKDVIRLAKNFGVIPLMMITTLSSKGEPNIELAYSLLLNEEYQDRNINNMLNIMKEKGIYGVNMVFSFLSDTNQILYKNMIAKVSKRLHEEGFLYFVTLNKKVDSEAEIGKVDFSEIEHMVDGINIVRFVWGTNKGAPVPIISGRGIEGYINYLVNYISPDRLAVGIPLIGYEWILPYVEGQTIANALTINSILSLAHDVGASIQFDEESQTPFVEYNQFNYGYPAKHIIRFTDARSLHMLLDIVNRFGLSGTGVWNAMVYYQQLWLMINSQFDIIKYLPDDLQ